MPTASALEAARGGMDYERLRLEAASRNIANANAPIAPGAPGTLWRVRGAPDFAGAALDAGEAEVRQVYDPGHPMAGADGMVRYPAVDLVQEMTTLMTAGRGYEADVRAFNFLRGMQARALEIGGK
ncbi:MAG: flagellar basal body rod protein FlgC [Lysobacteraceae bacterium]